MFLILRNLTVYGMRAEQSQIVFGGISPTAVTGFAHKLCLDINRHMRRCLLQDISAALVIHDYVISKGSPKRPPLKKGRPEELPTVLDDRRANGVVSLIIQIDVNVPGRQISLIKDEIVHAVTQRLSGMLFGGGRIISRLTNQNVLLENELEDVIEGIKHNRLLNKGFILRDRRDILESSVDSENDPLDVVLDYLSYEQVGDGANKWKRKHQEGWIVPIFVGYQALEPPVYRVTSRFPERTYKHAYAESIISLGQYLSVKALSHSHDSRSLFQSCFWRHEADADSFLYHVTTR